MLYDVSDDTFVDGFLPYVEATTAQKIGSNNTYNRRYSLVTMLGLEDVDDDGEEASTPQTVARPIAPVKPAQKAPISQNDNDIPW